MLNCYALVYFFTLLTAAVCFNFIKEKFLEKFILSDSVDVLND